MKSAIYACIALVAIGLAAISCNSKTESKYQISPVDKLVRDLDKEKTYSIVLYDMQVDEAKKLYQHKYKITKDVENKDSKPTTTDWTNVSEQFFAENMDNMGLELASKSPDGKVHKIPSPPGVNGYVGNEKYGQWQTRSDGTSFWAFYGQYMFMSSMLNLATAPMYRSTYNDYYDYRNNPNTRNMPYYGTADNRYGTNSDAGRKTNPNFFERRQQQQQMSSFRQKVLSNPTKFTRATQNINAASSAGSTRYRATVPPSTPSTSPASSSDSKSRVSRSGSRSGSSEVRSRGSRSGK